MPLSIVFFYSRSEEILEDIDIKKLSRACIFYSNL